MYLGKIFLWYMIIIEGKRRFLFLFYRKEGIMRKGETQVFI
jgi:hypothetical protein